MCAPSPLPKVLVLLVFLWGAKALNAQGTRPLVELNTTMGRMVLALYNETPAHRDNFLKLVREHYYDSTLFHRVIPGFMAQGGDPESRGADDRHKVLGRSGPGYTLPPEIRPELVHTKGAVGAAGDPEAHGSEGRTSGSQFYIVQGQPWSPSDLRQQEQRMDERDPSKSHMHTPEQVRAYATSGGSPHLDGEYTVFAQVVEGLDVLDHICALPCDGNDRPMSDVRIWMRVLTQSP